MVDPFREGWPGRRQAGSAGVSLAWCAWSADESGGALGVAGGDGRGDRRVLVPDRLAPRHRLQRGAHHPAQAHPMGTGALADQRVAGSFVDRAVEGDVGFDHRLDVRAAGGLPAGLDQRRIERGPAFRGEARGQGVDRAAHFVDLSDLGGVERGDDDAAARARRAPGRPASAGAAPAAPAAARRPAARRSPPESVGARQRAIPHLSRRRRAR